MAVSPYCWMWMSSAEYAVGSQWNRRTRRELVHRRDELVATLKREAEAARDNPRPHGDD